MKDKNLEERFDEEMPNIYLRAKTECGYNATRFLQMVTDVGGLQAAKTLLRGHDFPDGLTALWERDRLDLTIEALVIRPHWNTLFTAEEPTVARNRLENFIAGGSRCRFDGGGPSDLATSYSP